MTGHASLKDATEQLSPRSLPITDALSTSPERESAEHPVCPPKNSRENLSVPSSAREPLRLSTEGSSASEYDQLSRSPLLDSEPGLGPSGLDRIRSQPASRVFTLPNMSTSSVAPTQGSTSPPAPRSATSSRAGSVYIPSTSNAPPPVVEDLHRFPTESLHSFSFTEQSGELLQTRQTFLKRSIDFMRDRLGLAHSAAQARANSGAEYQSMVDSLSKTGISEEQEVTTSSSLPASQGPPSSAADQGRESSPPESRTLHGSRAGNRSLLSSGVLDEHAAEDGTSTFTSPSTDDHVYSHEADLKCEPVQRPVLNRTFTDHSGYSHRNKLLESPSQLHLPSESTTSLGLGLGGSAVHTHSSKWTPVSQAVFRTEDKAPWTILAANDLACLVFGVKQSEVRKLSILEIVQEERRAWLESKLQTSSSEATAKTPNGTAKSRFNMSKALRMGGGVTAQLLSKPSSRQKAGRRAQTDDGFGSSTRTPRRANNAEQSKSRGVLLCGDVVPIQKRNGLKGSASLWVMEKRGGLIWVLEEITEHVAHLTYDKQGRISAMDGDVHEIWDPSIAKVGASLADLLPRVPVSFEEILKHKYFAARTQSDKNCIPMTITRAPEGGSVLRASTFPHVAGMMVLSSSTLNIISSNSVFSAALFGYERPEGHRITELIPDFERLLQTLAQEDQVALVDGVVIPEQSFRRARALMALRDDKASAASVFLEPEGIPIRHRDGCQIQVDIQMRVIKSETAAPEESRVQEAESASDHDDADEEIDTMPVTEIVYALWITFSRQTHAPRQGFSMDVAKVTTSLPQPQVGQPSPPPSLPSHSTTPSLDNNQAPSASLRQELSEAASTPMASSSARPESSLEASKRSSAVGDSPKKKRTIDDYVILEEMGQGAYGQVKLARLKDNPSKKTVLKYVTKKRILVDTWTRDRRLGTVPLEIHVLDYLRRDGFKHPNIVEMEGFFEDDVNYYIEMVPHGLPGMDLFDYIELRANMDEAECRNIFKQVVDAIHHLHTKALVVHRDIKDENVILDGDGRIKLIDFGSAAYIKNGPFNVFVGTIDYAAPEVLQGKSYRGKEQDVWALGILLYTIVYKENPFYNVDEILDHPLRVPFLPFSEDCIDLIRKMLDRDVDNRLTITEVMNHPWLTAS